MDPKIKLDKTEFDFDGLSDQGKATFLSLKFTNTRIREMENMQKVLQIAKENCMNELKKEILSDRTGLVLDDN